MTIHVTQEDIERGTPKKVCRCPIARAIRRETGINWEVYPQVICKSGARVYIELPKIAVRFIRNFDKGKPVEPISFELEFPTSEVPSC